MFFIIGGEDKKKEAAVVTESFTNDIYIFITQRNGRNRFKAKHLKETINLETLSVASGKCHKLIFYSGS
jgi:hypothetical protein